MHHSQFRHHAVIFLLSWTVTWAPRLHCFLDLCISLLCFVLRSSERRGDLTQAHDTWYHILALRWGPNVECCLSNQAINNRNTCTPVVYIMCVCVSRSEPRGLPCPNLFSQTLRSTVLRFILIWYFSPSPHCVAQAWLIRCWPGNTEKTLTAWSVLSI